MLLSSILLVAAGLKSYELANDAMPETSVWTSRWFLSVVVLLEVGAGLWFLTGLYPGWTRFAMAGLFLVFFEINFYEILKGHQTCACLGKVQASLWLMLLLDGMAALTLLCWAPPKEDRATIRAAPGRFCGFVIVYALLALPAGLSMAFFSPRGLALDLRAERGLQVKLQAKMSNPTSEGILKQLHKATELTFTMDKRLLREAPEYGVWNLGKAWSVMIGMAEKQKVAARWEKTESGYHLAQATPFGDRSVPWIISGAIFGVLVYTLVCAALTFGVRTVLKPFGF